MSMKQRLESCRCTGTVLRINMMYIPRGSVTSIHQNTSILEKTKHERYGYTGGQYRGGISCKSGGLWYEGKKIDGREHIR